MALRLPCSSFGAIVSATFLADIRSLIRLEMSLLRQTQISVMNSLSDSKQKAAAEKVYASFKLNINDLDYACVSKDQSRAAKSYKSVVKDLNEWRKVVGI